LSQAVDLPEAVGGLTDQGGSSSQGEVVGMALGQANELATAIGELTDKLTVAGKGRV